MFNKQAIASGALINGLYKLDLNTIENSKAETLMARSRKTIHEEFAHLSPHIIVHMKNLCRIYAAKI